MQITSNIVPNRLNRDLYDDEILSEFIDEVYFTFPLPEVLLKAWVKVGINWTRVKAIFVKQNLGWNAVKQIKIY